MNKKFLSAILFGALAVASTGSFVSCKDYDDEIDNLQTQINGLASAKDLSDKVSQLQSAITAAQKAAEDKAAAAEAKAAEAKKAADDAAAAADTAVAEAKKAAADEAEKVAKELRQEADDLKAEVEKTSKDLQKLMDDLKKATEDNIKDLNDQFVAYKKTVEKTLSGSASALKSIVFQPDLYVDGIEAAKYTYLKYMALKADADKYVGDKYNNLGNTVSLLASAKAGYTVTQYYHLGNIVDFVEPTGNKSQSENLTCNEFVGTPKTSGEVNTIKFAVNPANAVVTKDQAKLIAQNVIATTRATEDKHEKDAKLTVTDASVEKGILTISYTVDSIGALISANHKETSEIKTYGHKNTTMFHAEITNVDDAVIESDWAMIYENAVQPVAIAWNKKGDEQATQKAPYCKTDGLFKELYKNPYEALLAKPSLAVGYDDKKGIDLYDLLELHMIGLNEKTGACPGNDLEDGEKATHTAISLADAKAKYGLTVKFTPVSYETEETAGPNASGNKTQPSNYINPALGEKGTVIAGIVKASDGSFDKDATSYTNESEGISSVSKQPLVQVLVMKGEDVVLEGYIKLEITRISKSVVAPVLALGDSLFNCNGVNFLETWYQASTLVLEQTMKMSKTDFDLNYRLNTYNYEAGAEKNDPCAVWYSKPEDKANLKIENIYGIIKEVPDPKGTTNTVLCVALDKYAQQYILEDLKGIDTIYVKYVPKDAVVTEDGYCAAPGVFVPLEVKLHQDNTVLSMTKKINEYWYSADGKINQEPDAALRANVNYPADKSNSYNIPVPSFKAENVEGFVRDIRSAFEVYAKSGKNDVVLMNGEKVFATTTDKDGTKTKFYLHPSINGYNFVGDDNVKYTLYVDNDFVQCDKWIDGDGPDYCGMVEHRSAKAKLHDEIKDIAKLSVDELNELAKTHNINTAAGIFLNTSLYVTINDSKEKIEVAQLDPNTGNIWYKHTPAAQQLLNAAGHNEAKAKAYVGVYAANDCKSFVGVKDGVFPVFFFRPLDLGDPKAKEVVDATGNGDITPIADLLTFQDWRDIKIDATNGNGWLLAYYGVKSLTVDLGGMTTNLNGHNLATDSLANVTKEVQFTLVDIADESTPKKALAKYYGTPERYTNEANLTDYCVEATWKSPSATQEILGKLFGGKIGLMYENNGFNVYDWTVRIPVTIGYDWGSFKTYVDVKVVKTIANGGQL